MQAITGAVKTHADLVAQNREAHAVGLARFREPAYVVGLLKGGDDGLFDNALAVGDAGKPGADAVAVHGEDCVGGQERGPVGGLDTLEEGIERVCTEGADLQQDAFGVARPEVCTGKRICIAREGNTTVGGLDVFKAQTAEFIGGDALDTKQAGRMDSEIVHIVLSLYYIRSDSVVVEFGGDTLHICVQEAVLMGKLQD